MFTREEQNVDCCPFLVCEAAAESHSQPQQITSSAPTQQCLHLDYEMVSVYVAKGEKQQVKKQLDWDAVCDIEETIVQDQPAMLKSTPTIAWISEQNISNHMHPGISASEHNKDLHQLGCHDVQTRRQ